MEELHVCNIWTSLAVLLTNQLGTAPHIVSSGSLLCGVSSYIFPVDGVPYASGTGTEKGEARENAARNCYMILRPQ